MIEIWHRRLYRYERIVIQTVVVPFWQMSGTFNGVAIEAGVYFSINYALRYAPQGQSQC